MARLTQKQRIVRALQRGGITRNRAESFGIRNVRAVVTLLRGDGYDIQSNVVRKNGTTRTKYFLAA